VVRYLFSQSKNICGKRVRRILLTNKKLGYKTLEPIPKGINFNVEGENDE
jgi:hypothetical protein